MGRGRQNPLSPRNRPQNRRPAGPPTVEQIKQLQKDTADKMRAQAFNEAMSRCQVAEIIVEQVEKLIATHEIVKDKKAAKQVLKELEECRDGLNFRLKAARAVVIQTGMEFLTPTALTESRLVAPNDVERQDVKDSKGESSVIVKP